MRIAIANQKGGAGKTTLAVAIGCELHARGKRVLLVDGDAAQGTLSTFSAVAVEGGQASPTVVAMGSTMHRQLASIAGTFDHVIVDCPGRADAVTRSALMACDACLIPTGQSASDLWALAGTTAMIREAMAVRPEFRAAIVITRRQGRTSAGREARTVAEQVGLPVLQTMLGYRVCFQDSLAAGLGPAQYAPSDVGRLEVEHLVDELFAWLVEEGPHARVA